MVFPDESLFSGVKLTGKVFENPPPDALSEKADA
jgi:hypothetical protein